MNNSYKELPEGYKESLHINDKSPSTTVKFLLLGILLMAAVIGIFIGIAAICKINVDMSREETLVVLFSFFGVLVAYIVLHELTHGITYKAFTHEKLTFGYKVVVAYCGIPNAYVNRKTAIWSTLMPFLVFNVVFIVGAIIGAFIYTPLYYGFAFMMGLHVSGCIGDLELACLLLFKYKNPSTLMRDSGPEQWIYEKE